MLRIVCLAVAAAIVLMSQLDASAADRALGDGQAAPAWTQAGETQDTGDVSRGGERCSKAGTCWILPARAGGAVDRHASRSLLRKPSSARAEAKWRAGPPEQPPRTTA